MKPSLRWMWILFGVVLGVWATVVIVRSVPAFGAVVDRVQVPPRAATTWEYTIRRFEQRDRLHPPPPGAIVLVGSSSVRLWASVGQDLGRVVVRRGFGGGTLAQVTYFAGRIIVPYRPRAILIYAGENDLASPRRRESPERLLAKYLALVALLERRLPGTPVYFISIKPSLSRFGRWPVMRRANELIRSYAATRDHLHYIDVSSPMMRAGRPIHGIYRRDGLHLNRRGYLIWRAAIRPILDRDLGPPPHRALRARRV